MRHVREISLLALCACGRLAFDASDDTSDELRLSYPVSEAAALRFHTAISLVPIASTAMQFSVSPALPAGIQLDPVSGVIAGMATELADEVDYTVTGTAGAASVSAVVRLTVLPGSAVDVTADIADDDGGVDDTCFATAANGCTLRAAVQTANRRGEMNLILLDAKTYPLASALEPIINDIEIAGQGAEASVIRAASVHPGFGALTLATSRKLRLKRATFQDFGSTDGAVVKVTAGTLEVDAAAFLNNHTEGSGGVLFINGGATARFRRSTFIGNHASIWGGVIDGEGDFTRIVVDGCTAMQNSGDWGSFSHITTGTTLLLRNSTLYGNMATRAGTLATPGGAYTLVNDTIAYNTNSYPDSAAIYLHSAPCLYTVSNTIVAFNTDGTGAQSNCNRNDTSTVIVSQGGNLISDGAGNCATYFNAAGDRLGMDPGLDPGGPAANGGPTRTVLLMPASKALDAGRASECPVEDQRGFPRPGANGPCDVGAVEMP